MLQREIHKELWESHGGKSFTEEVTSELVLKVIVRRGRPVSTCLWTVHQAEH
jgi:hypothetical protein